MRAEAARRWHASCKSAGMRDNASPSPYTASSWHASLRLRFDRIGASTRLATREHAGPLRVQKALYPEGPAICHAIMLHPPGGVVGGDTLQVDAEAQADAHAFLTTPGAAKWYRANGKVSRQQVLLTAGPGAVIEWMPQETIFYNGAQVALAQSVDLAADAHYIGSEVLCFGRRARGEVFDHGWVQQSLQVRRGDKLLWWEQGRIDPAALASPLGLDGYSVCASLLAVGAVLPATMLAAVRALDPALAASQVKSVFIARYLGDDSEAARQLMAAVWALARPQLLGCAAHTPRIWRT